MSRRLVDGKLPVKPKGANKGGAPTDEKRIDDKLMANLRQALLIGAPVVTAAAINDIDYDTMRRWVLNAKEKPQSRYGELIRLMHKAIAEYEARDLSVIEAHALGRPAQYLQQQARTPDGQLLFGPDGKPVMEYVRDAEGNLILTQSEIKSDWRAAMERLSRRKPRSWTKHLNIDLDAVLTFTNEEREVNPKEALTFEQRIAEAVRELEDEV